MSTEQHIEQNFSFEATAERLDKQLHELVKARLRATTHDQAIEWQDIVQTVNTALVEALNLYSQKSELWLNHCNRLGLDPDSASIEDVDNFLIAYTSFLTRNKTVRNRFSTVINNDDDIRYIDWLALFGQRQNGNDDDEPSVEQNANFLETFCEAFEINETDVDYEQAKSTLMDTCREVLFTRAGGSTGLGRSRQLSAKQIKGEELALYTMYVYPMSIGTAILYQKVQDIVGTNSKFSTKDIVDTIVAVANERNNTGSRPQTLNEELLTIVQQVYEESRETLRSESDTQKVARRRVTMLLGQMSEEIKDKLKEKLGRTSDAA